MTSRAVNFATSETITHYDVEIDRRSLVWYKAEDLQRFKEERLIEASKIRNRNKKCSKHDDDQICWWGLERLVVPSVMLKTMHVKEQVKQVVLWKQDGACSDKTLRRASKWALEAAQKKASYYSSHL